MDIQRMSKQRKYMLAAAAIGVVAMFLPWVTIPFLGIHSSINGLHDKGILVFLSFALAGVVAYMGDQTKNLSTRNWFIVLVAAALATVIMLWYFLQAVSNDFSSSLLSIGFYLAALSAIALLVVVYRFKSATDTVKGGFDELKHNINDKLEDSSGKPL